MSDVPESVAAAPGPPGTHSAGVAAAIAKQAQPPAACQAWASARQRMAWPVPI